VEGAPLLPKLGTAFVLLTVVGVAAKCGAGIQRARVGRCCGSACYALSGVNRVRWNHHNKPLHPTACGVGRAAASCVTIAEHRRK
jgi:hypothetical protein